MIAIIAAMTKDRVIGKDNKLPWHIKEDLKLFKALTLGKIVIMGRQTFESIGKPLPGRTNIVLTRTEVASDNVMTFEDIKDALEFARKLDKNIFFIGGASVYQQALEFADRLYISHVKKDYEGDTYFPDFGDEWKVIKRKDFDEFELRVYERS